MEPTFNHPLLPHIREVRQIVQSGRWEDDTASVVLICPDPMSGRPNRYSVIRVHRFTGKATCIGRELPLREAREVAHRPESRDGTPLLEAWARTNQKNLRRWERRAQSPSPSDRKYAREMLKLVQKEIRAHERATKEAQKEDAR